jgi:hypothetical protein
MNEQTTPPAAPATSKPKRTRTPKPVKVRTVDPAIQALREQHKAAVAELRKSRKSGAVLAGIVKKLPKLTMEDRNKLSDLIQPGKMIPQE